MCLRNDFYANHLTYVSITGMDSLREMLFINSNYKYILSC